MVFLRKPLRCRPACGESDEAFQRYAATRSHLVAYNDRAAQRNGDELSDAWASCKE